MPKRTVKQMAKTWELNGAALDYAVAMAEGVQVLLWSNSEPANKSVVVLPYRKGEYPCLYNPSIGDAGDAIIDREKISTLIHHSGVWLAYLGFNHNDDRKFMTTGSTRREAAMRCWARSKLGDEIDIPKELTNG